MNDDYNEVPLRRQRPLPWKMKSLPKFIDVPGRKFNSCPNAKSDDGEPPTPPPSPIGTFKYPALLRSRNSWAGEAIVAEVCKSTNREVADPGDKKLIKVGNSQEERPTLTMRKFLIDVKPASGKTKMYLWPQPKNKYCPKLDLNSLTQADSAMSFKASTSKVFGAAKSSDNFIPEKSTNILEAGDMKKDTSASSKMILNSLSNCVGAMSTGDFGVILKHALSHDVVMARRNSTPRIQRRMSFADKSKAVYPREKKRVIFEDKKSLMAIDSNRLNLR